MKSRRELPKGLCGIENRYKSENDENDAKTEAKPALRHQCETSNLSTSYTRFGEKRVFRSYCDHIGFELPEKGAIIYRPITINNPRLINTVL